MRTGTCDRCGTEFDDRSPAQMRRFCSANCRKRHCDDTTLMHPCAECGKSIRHKSTRCLECEYARRASVVGPRLEQLWAEGKTIREISVEFGWDLDSAKAMTNNYRKRGFRLPYRRSAKARRNIRAGIQIYLDREAA